MSHRRRLTKQEREVAASEAGKLRPDRRHFTQEWTDPDGNPVVIAIIER